MGPQQSQPSNDRDINIHSRLAALEAAKAYAPQQTYVMPAAVQPSYMPQQPYIVQSAPSTAPLPIVQIQPNPEQKP